MSKVKDKPHDADDSDDASTRSILQGPNINGPSSGNNLNSATFIGPLVADTPIPTLDLQPGRQVADTYIAGHSSSSVPCSLETASSSQNKPDGDNKLPTNERSRDTHLLTASPSWNENAASISQISTVLLPSHSLAIRAMVDDRACFQPELSLSPEKAGFETRSHAAGRLGVATEVLADPNRTTSHAPQDMSLVQSAVQELAALHATSNLKHDMVASTAASLRKDGTSQPRKMRKETYSADKRPGLHMVSASRVMKAYRRPGHQYEMQWRVGQAPRMGMLQNQEQMHYENILSAIGRYYSGNAETRWKPALSQNSVTLAQDFEPLHFLGLTVTVAGLITAGRSVQEHEALKQIAPAARSMLVSYHPMTFWLLIDQVMDTSQTVLGNLRVAITPKLASLASTLLGPSHPLTILFKTPLTAKQKVQLRLQAQSVVHAEMARVFGPYAYQTFIQYGYYARTVMNSGRPEEAIRMLSEVTEVLNRHYGLNSAMPTLGMIEQARQELANGSSSVMLECMLGDVLRRNHILYTGSRNTHNDSMDIGEDTLRGDYLLVMRLVTLRLLGRLHARRRNFAAAIFHFDLAVATARPLLIPGSNTMRMCEADLTMAKLLEVEQAMGILGDGDPYDRFMSPFSITQWIPMEDRVVHSPASPQTLESG
ncbi:hypothetical protein LTR84_009574 [Exophiala bonariae]|uniref:Uncharacterized protein n=1 Tax=Exophiala bonariae TaxID=1690606 RepID=A0AAV9NJ48_9EURO|nr:hypothetical protein LTR84_009574 [Exophiala bonariae]